MIKKLLLIFLVAITLVGCTGQKNFEYGLGKLNAVNSKYNTTIYTYPRNYNDTILMLAEVNELKGIKLDSGQKAFDDLLKYRGLNLQAEKLFLEGQKFGASGFTKDGFGCKERPLIIESVALRNQSALKGFGSYGLANSIIEEYPYEANLAGLSPQKLLITNVTFTVVYKDARKDSSIINNFCPQNVTLDIYKQSLRKQASAQILNLSEDYINNLSYGDAVKIYKQSRGFE